MGKISPPWFETSNYGDVAAISVVGITFLVTYLGLLQDDTPPSWTARLVALLLGGIYLLLLLRAEWILNGLGTAVYFIIQLTLAISIQFILFQSPTIWLITMPLVGHVVEILSGWWRWFMYAAILGILTLAFGIQTGNWGNALLFTLYFAPALIFVIIFVQLTQTADAQRLQAEQLTVELEAANHQLAAYAAQAEELATTKERNRIAREIHDTLGHYLTVVNMQIKAAQAVMGQQPEKAQDVLQKAQKLTEEGLTAVRQSVSTLRDSPIGHKPLPATLANLLAETENSGIVTQFDILGEPRLLDAKLNLTLYRAVQEGLTNIRKHARASRVDLQLDFSQADQVRLRLKDNGVGTAVSTATDHASNGSFGLIGLRERVHLLGGHLQTETAPGNGFILTITLPS
jgi:signal transduction histidine kinase